MTDVEAAPTALRSKISTRFPPMEAVTIEVHIGSHRVAAILVTGAKPSVMDMGTVERLKLEDKLVPAVSKIDGLCNNPVRVRGYIDVAIGIVALKPMAERVQVLDSRKLTLLLGRRFMGNIGAVTFDWANGWVKVGSSWVTAQSVLSGATPLARAMVAKQDDEPEVQLVVERLKELVSAELSEKNG